MWISFSILLLAICFSQNEAKPQWNIPDFKIPQAPKIPGLNSFSTPEEARSRSLSSRIINGMPAALGQFPHQVRSRTKVGPHKYSICGGSIISETVVLTAAHCVKGHESFDLGFGSIEFNNPEVEVTTTDKIIHPEYDHSHLHNDIALLILPSALEFTKNIKPIQLPSYSQTDMSFADEKATVSGHGKTGDDESSSKRLMYVHVKVIDNEECTKFYGKKLIKDFTICTVGWNKRSSGTCQGDSGGPLITYDEDLDDNIQIGVVSFVAGTGCESKVPAGYVRVTSYLDWIAENSDVEIRS
uniref:CSON014307 protein n=1 Tax=Culicoides sonorensis TaxID=179676 RepID=A0A336LS69_CULSO